MPSHGGPEISATPRQKQGGELEVILKRFLAFESPLYGVGKIGGQVVCGEIGFRSLLDGGKPLLAVC
jgi:hypothetical protein